MLKKKKYLSNKNIQIIIISIYKFLWDIFDETKNNIFYIYSYLKLFAIS